MHWRWLGVWKDRWTWAWGPKVRPRLAKDSRNVWMGCWGWSMAAALCSWPLQNTENVWQSGAERPILLAWCTWFFCDKSTNKNMAWQWLSIWWGCYQMVQWISKTSTSEITLYNWCMPEDEKRLWKQQIIVLKLSDMKITTPGYILTSPSLKI